MSILGNRVLRLEDPRFLRGEGTYIENLPLEGARTVTFVRSLLAHARIVSVDASAAEELPNVRVLTGADVDVTTGPPPIPVLEQRMRRPAVAKDVVRFVGDIVAIVLSPDRGSGADAAELVQVEYDALPVVVSPVEAAKDDVLLYPEIETNVAGRAGSPEHDDSLFEGCDVVVSETLVSQRMAACPLEVRSAAAEVGADGRVTAWLSTQVPHRDHLGICGTLGWEPGDLRVIAPDVGGGFGAKSAFSAEEALVVWLARHLGEPVRWTETRSESMIALPQGRGQHLEVTLGGTRDGKLLAYRLDIIQDAGAYPGVSAFLPNLTALLASGVYAIPRIEVEGVSVVTNTTPMTTFRGAGRPEAAQAIERVLDVYRGRDRHGSGGRETQELHPEGRVPLPDRVGCDLRLRGLRRRARSRTASGRLRRAARRAAPSSRRGRGQAAGSRRQLVHGGHESPRRGGVRRGRDHARLEGRSFTAARSRTARGTRRRSR